MSPVEVEARLDDRFRVLRRASGPERHRTLEAVIDWSYRSLQDDESDLFDRLSVFSSGAMLDAVASVCDLDEMDALDILDRLASRSMITVIDTPQGTRYRQLETLRAFGEQRLDSRGITEEARIAHMHWALEVTGWIARCAVGRDELLAFQRYLSEIADLRTAVSTAIAGGRTTDALALLARLLPCALQRPSLEVLDWIDDELFASAPDRRLASTVAGLLAQLAFFAGDPDQSAELIELAPDRDPEDRSPRDRAGPTGNVGARRIRPRRGPARGGRPRRFTRGMVAQVLRSQPGHDETAYSHRRARH